MSNIELKTNAPGLDKVIKDFTALDKTQQKLIVTAAGLGRNLDKTTKKGNKGFIDMKKHVADIGKGFLSMVGAGGGLQLFNTIMGQIRKKMEETLELQRQASQGQRSVVNALGGIVSNNPSITDDELKRIRQQTGTFGRRLGAGGQVKLIDTFKDLIPISGTNDQKFRAIDKASRAAEIDPNTDLSAFAKSTLNISNSLRNSKDKEVQDLIKGKVVEDIAVGIIKNVGLQFTGDASNALKQVTKLQSNQALGTNLSEAAALFGVASQANDDTEGLKSARTVQSALGKILTADDKKVGGKKLTFQSDKGFDRLIEFSERLGRGDFGRSDSDKAQAVKTVVGESSEVLNLVLSLSEPGATKNLKDNLQNFKAAFDGTNLLARDRAKLSRVTNIDQIKETDRLEGIADTALSGNSKLASFEEAQKRINAVNKGFGLTSRFGQSTIQDLKRNFTSPEEFFNSEIVESFKRSGFAEDDVEIIGKGTRGQRSVNRGAGAFETSLRRSGDLRSAAVGAVGQIDTSDGLQTSEKTLLAIAGATEKLISQLEQDKISLADVAKLLEQGNEDRKNLKNEAPGQDDVR